MKHIYFLFLLISTVSFAQLTPPANLQAYYTNVDFTKTGTDLFNDLATETAVKHTNFLSYTPGVWESSKITDEDPNNSNNVVLIYGWENSSDGDVTNDLSRSKNSTGGSVGDWNREHTYAKSRGTPNLGTSGPGSDAHHLRPSDVQRNGQRGNQKFADGSGNSGNVTSGWFPGDATSGGTDWRGDVARMMMYMYVRYGNQCLPSNVCVGTTNVIDANMINLLLDWNAADPVSTIEDNRNTYHANTSNTYAQGNRNPFIDNPYLATVIWGGTQATNRWGSNPPVDTENPTAPTNLVASNPTQNSIDISWTASTDNTGVATYEVYIDNVYSSNSSSTSYTATGLASETNYCFTVFAKDFAGNTSTISNQDCETTTVGSTGSATELFFSEYVEGNSFNKALEIVNLTSSAIDLSSYSIKRNGNGGTSWDSALNLSGTIASGDVFVIINSDAPDTTLQTEADLTINNVTPMTFNGNDPIGLFKNNVLIDIIGEFNQGNANFAKDVTLRRKSNVSSPNTTFLLAAEWDSYPKNTFSDIGMHTSSLGVDTFNLETIRIYPNPTKTNSFYIKTLQPLTLEIFNILAKKVISQQVNANNNRIDISDLSKGLYLVRLISEHGEVTKKLIKQ
jgi:endonuclease I